MRNVSIYKGTSNLMENDATLIAFESVENKEMSE
jgi:hypothetical protein